MSKHNSKTDKSASKPRGLKRVFYILGLAVFIIASTLSYFLYTNNFKNAQAAINCSAGAWDGSHCVITANKVSSTTYKCPDGSNPDGSNQCGVSQNYLWRCDGRAGETNIYTGDWGGGQNLSLCTYPNISSAYFRRNDCQYSYALFDNGNGNQETRADRFNYAFNYDGGYTNYGVSGYNGQTASQGAFCENGGGCTSGFRALMGEATKRYGTSDQHYNTMQLLCVSINLLGTTYPSSPLFTIAGGKDNNNGFYRHRQCGDNIDGGDAPDSVYNGSSTLAGDQYGNDHGEVVWLCTRNQFAATGTTSQVCPDNTYTDGGGSTCYKYGTVTGYTVDNASVGSGSCAPTSTTQGVKFTKCTFPLTSPVSTTFITPSEGLFANILNTNGDNSTRLGDSTACVVNGNNLECSDVPVPNNTNVGSHELIIHQPGVAFYNGKGTVQVGSGLCTNGALNTSFPTCTTCPAGQFYNPINNANTCVTQCPAGSFANLVNNTCVAQCPVGTFTYKVNNTCVAQCPVGFTPGADAVCYPTACPPAATSCVITPEVIVNSSDCKATKIVVIPQTYDCKFPLFGNNAGKYVLPQAVIKAYTSTTTTSIVPLANSGSAACTILVSTGPDVLVCTVIKTTGGSDGQKNVLIGFNDANYVDRGDVELFDPAGDRDNDGIPNDKECNATATNCPDTDSDGIPDYKDTDSDNDGIPDSVEKSSTCATLTNCIPVDTDNDTIPDFRDPDSDNDGIPDSVEKSSTCATLTNCIPVDTDSDTKPNYIDTDSDNDGIPDSIEGRDNQGKPTGVVTTPVDTDGDTKPDYVDTDSDNDGLLDINEKGQYCASLTTCIPQDSDGDGVPDYRQTSISAVTNTLNSADCTSTTQVIIPNTYSCSFKLTGNTLNSYNVPTTGIKAYTATDSTGASPLANSSSDACVVVDNKLPTAKLKCDNIHTTGSSAGQKNVLLGYASVAITKANDPFDLLYLITGVVVHADTSVSFVDKGDVTLIIVNNPIRSGGDYIASIIVISVVGITGTLAYYYTQRRRLQIKIK